MKKNKKLKESFNNLSNVKSLKKINNITEQQSLPCNQQDFDNIADQHDLSGLFVNGNPTNFISRMLTKYQNKGCDSTGGVFQKIKDKHDGHLASGMGGPQGNKPMGPKWKAQKESKTLFLNTLMDTCCPFNPSDNDPTVVPENSLYEAEKASDKKGGTKKCKKDSDCGDPGKWSCVDGQCIIACKKGESDTECKARQKKSLKEGNIHLNHSLVERMQKLANIIK